MATPPGPLDPEVLEQGRSGRAGVPRFLRASRGRSLVLWTAALVLLAGALVADQQARRREERDVARCVSVATSTVATAAGRLTIMARYVGPSLAGSLPGSLREALLTMVSSSAAPAAGPLQRARDRCVATRVLPFHTALRDVREDCVRLLSGTAAYLRAVARNGTRAYEPDDTAPGQCVARPS